MFRLQENRFTRSEDVLVKMFIAKYKDVEFVFGDSMGLGKFYEQIRVPEIGRVSDLIIHFDARLINIEFKIGDWACLLKQAKDHLAWCDYSYVCVPINWLHNYPQRFCAELIDNNIGLIVGSNDNFIEVFRAKHNTYKDGKNKSLRDKVFARIREPSLFSVADIVG